MTREFPPRTLLPADLIDDQALKDGGKDALGHAGIAAQVAELIEDTSPPTNIALFGPWGSGKSSFANLLDEELERAKIAKLVTYNAWTFAHSAKCGLNVCTLWKSPFRRCHQSSAAGHPRNLEKGVTRG